MEFKMKFTHFFYNCRNISNNLGIFPASKMDFTRRTQLRPRFSGDLTAQKDGAVDLQWMGPHRQLLGVLNFPAKE